MSRIWVLHMNLDEFNAVCGGAFTEADRSALLGGLQLGCNGGELPEGASKVVRSGFEVASRWRDEAEGFKEASSTGGRNSAAARRLKYGTANPKGVRSDHEGGYEGGLNQSPIHNPQPTNQNPQADNPTKSSPAVSAGCLEVVAIWNSVTLGKLPQAKATRKRALVIKTRMKEPGWLDDFRAACAYLITQPWATGQGDKPWTATIDYLLREGKATENAEKSNGPKNGSPYGMGKPKRTHEADQAFLAQLETQGGDW